METRSAHVRALFEATQTYLEKGAHVQFRARLVREMLGEVRRQRILDLGCGNGVLSLQFLPEDNWVTLVDFSTNMLELARRNAPSEWNPNVEYIQSDLQAFQSERLFDVVLCIGVLAHVASVEETVMKVSQLLVPGGLCVFQFTDSSSSFAKLITSYYRLASNKNHGYDLNVLNHSEFITLASQRSLILIDSRQYLSVLPGMGWLRNSWIERFQSFTLGNKTLSRTGTDRLLLFKKVDAHSRY